MGISFKQASTPALWHLWYARGKDRESNLNGVEWPKYRKVEIERSDMTGTKSYPRGLGEILGFNSEWKLLNRETA